MAQGHISSEHTFHSLMASLRNESLDPRSPIERMQDANRRLQEATARLKQSSARLEYSVSNLQTAVNQLLEKYPELRQELPSEKSTPRK